MKQIEHWSGRGTIDVAQSAGGVLATVDPLANLVRGSVSPWPTPELFQKLYASDRWHGKTDEDDQASRACLGHYCDLQSLNSEDAITWSFFGGLIYGRAEWRTAFASCLMEELNFPPPRDLAIWLWRRVPHPEKPSAPGGPEIDFGILTECCLVLGEAKWNSPVAIGQGVRPRPEPA